MFRSPRARDPFASRARGPARAFLALALLPAWPLSASAAGPAPAGHPQELTEAQRAALRVVRLRVRPDSIRLRADGSVRLEVAALDSAGDPVEEAEVERLVRGRAASLSPSGEVLRGREPGVATLFVVLERPAPPRPEGRRGGRVRRTGPGPPAAETARRLVVRVPVRVDPLPVVRLELEAPAGPLPAGARVRVDARAFSRARPRPDAAISWSSSDPEVARVSPHGLVHAGTPGSAVVVAVSEGVADSVPLRVVPNPVRRLQVEAPEGPVRTGDVTRLRARPLDADGEPVATAPVEWSVSGPLGGMTGAAYLDDEGRFVAEEPGLFRVTASLGRLSAVAEIEAVARPARREMGRIGHGPVTGRSSSGLRVFEGVDGRDYAYTSIRAAGTEGSVLYAWDVTEPANPSRTDSVRVDAPAVSDVEINQTRNLAVVARAGAPDGSGGIVVLDIRIPGRPRVVSTYTGSLTAGVRSVWIEAGRVYAVHEGTGALHVIDVSDPRAPEHVGRWQLDSKEPNLRDVTIRDGLAYLAHGDRGLVILDVGSGVAGGTPVEPTLVSRYRIRSGWGDETHGTYGEARHAVRHGDHVFVAERILGCGECVGGPGGDVHVIDVSDPEGPREVARYRVPEAGAHGLWAEGDRLYVAYGQGGVRAVDLSGELRGDLYAQGREVAWYLTEISDPEAVFRPNAIMASAVQLHEGRLFVVDASSGLWILDPERRGGS